MHHFLTMKNMTAPVRAVAGFTRKAGTQISQGFLQIGSAISRSLATTVLRNKTAGAGEGFAVSVMDDRARGEKVNYRKAVIAAAIGALLVTGGSIGLNKAYSTGQETAQAVVKSGAEQSGSKFLLPIDLQYFSSKGTSEIQTGGRELSLKEWLRQEEEAIKMYDSIRNSTSDVSTIAKNTGIPEWRIQRIKEHVFIKEHAKSSGYGRFDPDYEIAQAWQRLQNGTHTQKDIELLNHEIFESKFEGIFKTDYEKAHSAAEKSGRVWRP
jgi:hypothetical protein